MKNKNLLEIKNISKKFNHKGNDITILDQIDLEIKEGEILGIIGRSGSGKSTLLRIMSNLIDPTSGEVLYAGKSIKESDPAISMVFQTFGLVPWLNVFDNVTIGLDKNKFSEQVIKDKGAKAINLVGLRGYEEAYPKEMSGGMRQRVGFARALVVDPEILLMDEPFSALDYLTANALKGDLLDLWFERSMLSIKSIVMVTHSIEEAVKLCDKVVLLSSNPGKIIVSVPIDISHPRDQSSHVFQEKVAELYSVMTNSIIGNSGQIGVNIHKNYPEHISVVNLFHFMQTLREKFTNQSATIKEMSDLLKLDHDKMIMYTDSLILLKFVELENDSIRLSSSGNILLDGDDNSKKLIFREHLVKNVPFVNTIYNMLSNSSDHTVTKEQLLYILDQKFDRDDAHSILKATVAWIRYADFASYDLVTEELKLEKKEIIGE